MVEDRPDIISHRSLLSVGRHRLIFPDFDSTGTNFGQTGHFVDKLSRANEEIYMKGEKESPEQNKKKCVGHSLLNPLSESPKSAKVLGLPLGHFLP